MKTFDEDIQQLVGWSVCAPGTGFVNHQGVMADPLFLLQEEGAEVANSFAQFDSVGS